MPRKIILIDKKNESNNNFNLLVDDNYEIIRLNGYNEVKSLFKNESIMIACIISSNVKLIKDLLDFNLPVIGLCNGDDFVSQEEALKNGAKAIITYQLSRAAVLATIAQTIRLHETLVLMSNVQKDILTGIFNRETFLIEAAKLI